jgi:hypothetical protein
VAVVWLVFLPPCPPVVDNDNATLLLPNGNVNECCELACCVFENNRIIEFTKLESFVIFDENICVGVVFLETLVCGRGCGRANWGIGKLVAGASTGGRANWGIGPLVAGAAGEGVGVGVGVDSGTNGVALIRCLKSFRFVVRIDLLQLSHIGTKFVISVGPLFASAIM